MDFNEISQCRIKRKVEKLFKSAYFIERKLLIREKEYSVEKKLIGWKKIDAPKLN